ncbi:hypothetical protein COOONC_22869 [Cooperia oncophora]
MRCATPLSFAITDGRLETHTGLNESDKAEKGKAGIKSMRVKNSTLIGLFCAAYDDKYTLSAEFCKESRSGQGKITKSIGAYINENGEVLIPIAEERG